jgi:hypothetical protein
MASISLHNQRWMSLPIHEGRGTSCAPSMVIDAPLPITSTCNDAPKIMDKLVLFQLDKKKQYMNQILKN